MLLADGATGSGQGRLAAQLFVNRCQSAFGEFPRSLNDVQAVFLAIDSEIRCLRDDSDTTGIALFIKENQYVYASVGDSDAWLLGRDAWGDLIYSRLTLAQQKKPRIGGHCAAPVVTQNTLPRHGALLIASDGLTHVDGVGDAMALSLSEDRYPAITLVDTLRARHPGSLPDDVSVIMVRWPVPNTHP